MDRQKAARAGQKASIHRFRTAVWRHYRRAGRHGLAWRRTRDPYRILVSEVMLQQTQVARVAKFYPRFVKQFPNFRVLARARTAALLRAWQGMGYNRRALALRRLARVVLEKYDGRLPRERAALEALPGIGPATAGAVRAFAWNEPEVFIETNIRRALIGSFFMKPARRREAQKVTDEELMRYIKRTLEIKNSRAGEGPREWYWALMDYGAALGGRSRSEVDPNKNSARYRRQPRFEGSLREARGKILQMLLRGRSRNTVTLSNVEAALGMPHGKAKKAVSALVQEGFMRKNRNIIAIV